MAEPGQAPALPQVFGQLAAQVRDALPSSLLGGSTLPARMSSHQLSAPAKLIRPALCLWACGAVGGDLDAALPGALAVEWVHNFTLVHDDVQDGDRLRRHRPTVWAVWGEAQAINAGDAMCARAFELLLEAPVPAARRVRAATLLARAVRRVVEGQCLDLAQEGRPSVSRAAYLRMTRLKTGALLGASLALGAVLGGGREKVPALARAGELLGLAFQARDDWLGMWGERERTGKPLGDLARRKVTYPVLEAYAAATPAGRRRLTRLFRDPSSAATEALAALLRDLGGPALGDAAAARFADDAVVALAAADLPVESGAEFAALARFVVRRVA